uniref:Uncharacterized protein n=1 Tax=Arundo donax TaxID=35708 RepID=A0A0A8YQ69_ARUDO
MLDTLLARATLLVQSSRYVYNSNLEHGTTRLCRWLRAQT